MNDIILNHLLGRSHIEEGKDIEFDSRAYAVSGGILRESKLVSEDQQQTSDAFGFKWNKRDTFERDDFLQVSRQWLNDRYGDVAALFNGNSKSLLDAGCGASLSALELFPEAVLKNNSYIGVDISNAVDVARDRFAERDIQASFMQADLCSLPLPAESIDCIFSEGVLHHTDSTENAIKSLAKLIRPGGHFLFYVYNKKGPIREFTDDSIREKLQSMAPQEAWIAMQSLTEFGKMLGDMDIELDIENPIDVLDIPAGKISLQRFFYWHVFKAFYRPDFSLEEMQHINFDWYAPKNAHRQTPKEVRQWCKEAGLSIIREQIENAGITIVAQKK